MGTGHEDNVIKYIRHSYKIILIISKYNSKPWLHKLFGRLF